MYLSLLFKTTQHKLIAELEKGLRSINSSTNSFHQTIIASVKKAIKCL